jgi:muramidase (phage lysozyme)
VFSLDVDAATLTAAGQVWTLELAAGPRQMLASGQWDALNALKTVFIEPKFNDKGFPRLLKDFEAQACTARGAVMIAVCRGKISEGLDLTDRCGDETAAGHAGVQLYSP